MSNCDQLPSRPRTQRLGRQGQQERMLLSYFHLDPSASDDGPAPSTPPPQTATANESTVRSGLARLRSGVRRTWKSHRNTESHSGSARQPWESNALDLITASNATRHARVSTPGPARLQHRPSENDIHARQMQGPVARTRLPLHQEREPGSPLSSNAAAAVAAVPQVDKGTIPRSGGSQTEFRRPSDVANATCRPVLEPRRSGRVFASKIPTHQPISTPPIGHRPVLLREPESSSRHQRASKLPESSTAHTRLPASVPPQQLRLHPFPTRSTSANRPDSTRESESPNSRRRPQAFRRSFIPLYAHSAGSNQWHDVPQLQRSRLAKPIHRHARLLPSNSTPPAQLSGPLPSRPRHQRSASDPVPQYSHTRASPFIWDAHSIASSNARGYPSVDTALEGSHSPQSTRCPTYVTARTQFTRRESAALGEPQRNSRVPNARGGSPLRRCAQVAGGSSGDDHSSVPASRHSSLVSGREGHLASDIPVSSQVERIQHQTYRRTMLSTTASLPNLRQRNGSISSDDYGMITKGYGNLMSIVTAGPSGSEHVDSTDRGGDGAPRRRSVEEHDEFSLVRDDISRREPRTGAPQSLQSTPSGEGRPCPEPEAPGPYITAPVEAPTDQDDDVRTDPGIATNAGHEVSPLQQKTQAFGKHAEHCTCLSCYQERMRRRFDCTRVWQRLAMLNSECRDFDLRDDGMMEDPLSLLRRECLEGVETAYRHAGVLRLGASEEVVTSTSTTISDDMPEVQEEERFASLLKTVRRLEGDVQAVRDAAQLWGGVQVGEIEAVRR